jgi:hypothetical protein
LSSEHIQALASAPEEFRTGFQAIYAGGRPSSRITVSDSTLRACLDTNPFPNLEHLHLLGCTNAGSNALMGSMIDCPKIVSIAFSAQKSPRVHISNMVFDHMVKRPPMALRYLEIDGYKVDKRMYDSPDPRMQMMPGSPAQRIWGLEMVVQYGKWINFFQRGGVG